MQGLTRTMLVIVAAAAGARVAGAQRPAPPPARIGQTPLATPHPRGGEGRWEGGRDDRWRRHSATPWWILPYAVEPQGFAEGAPPPSSPPVISGVTAIIDRRLPEPRPAPAPYDPRKASLTVIGGGVDGGGGVMKIVRRPPDSLQVTWLGAQRTVREARLFIADSLQQSLRSRVVTEGARAVAFSLATIRERAAYVGVAVVHDDGSRKTVLVPLR